MSGVVTPIGDGGSTISAGSVTGLDEAIDDRVDALLVAGPNIALAYDDTLGALTISATGGGLDVLDEGATVAGSLFDSLDFVGAGVTVTDAGGGVAQVSIPGGGGGGSLEVRDEGTTLTSAAGFLDFRGAGVAATTVSGGVQVSVPGAGGGEPGILTLTPPTVSMFATTLDGGRSGTFTDASYGVKARAVSPSGTGNGFPSAFKSLPSAGATGRRCIARFRRVQPLARYFMAGLALRDSASGKIRAIGPSRDADYLFGAFNYNSHTSINAAAWFGPWWLNHEFWLGIDITTGGTRNWRVSQNGYDWVQILSEVNTTFLTPDQWGFGMDPITNGTFTGQTIGYDVLHWSDGGY